MEDNGSPNPNFETDDLTYVLVTIPKTIESNRVSNEVKALLFNTLDEVIAYSNGVGNGAGNQAIELINEAVHTRVAEMLATLTTKIKRTELFEHMGLSNQSKNRARYLDPLIDFGWVSIECPEEPTHPNQMYSTTNSGFKILELIK